MSRTQLRDHDVLLNIVGATLDVIGRTAFLGTLPSEGANITQAMVVLRPKNKDLQPGFLFVYLNTCFAQDQIKRFARPTSQFNLNLTEVGHLQVPLLPDQEQEKIHALVISSSREVEVALASRSEAERLLDSELGLDKLTFRMPVGYTARLSDVETCRRLDAEHFYPAFQHLAHHLPKKFPLAPLSRRLVFCQRGKQPAYSDTGLRVINSKHVQPNRVVLEDNRLATTGPFRDLVIRSGDILLNGTGRGTLGRAAPYLEPSEALPDNHVTILRSPTLDPVFVSLYLNSTAGQLQVEMHQRGTSGQLELYPFDIRKFLIWDAPKSFQEELRYLHDRATAAESKSQALLAQAKQLVEELIEETVAK
jgi:type I restriction enzyme M protein